MSKRSITTLLQRFRSKPAVPVSTIPAKDIGIDGIQLQSSKLLWVTPFHHYRLCPEIHGPIKSELSKLTTKQYCKFIEAKQYEDKIDSMDPAVINNEFFKFQGKYLRSKVHTLDDEDTFMLNAGWQALEESESFKTLKDYIYQSLLLYFKDSIRNEEELGMITSMNLTAYSWISIHLNDSHHPSHTHADAVVSGVYYIRVPSNNNHSIKFQDPKGTDLYNPEASWNTRPEPFDNEFIIEPQEGDLLLFPSWLPHRVCPPTRNAKDEGDNVGKSSAPRLSLAFNVLGNWKRNASQHIDL